jgi:hypothetical protein
MVLPAAGVLVAIAVAAIAFGSPSKTTTPAPPTIPPGSTVVVTGSTTVGGLTVTGPPTTPADGSTLEGKYSTLTVDNGEDQTYGLPTDAADGSWLTVSVSGSGTTVTLQQSNGLPSIVLTNGQSVVLIYDDASETWLAFPGGFGSA